MTPDPGGIRRSAEIVFVDYETCELRELAQLLTLREHPMAIYVGDIDYERGLPPGTIVYGDFIKGLQRAYRMPLAATELLAYAWPKPPDPMPTNRTPRPMKEPHRSDWAQRRPRRRRRR